MRPGRTFWLDTTPAATWSQEQADRRTGDGSATATIAHHHTANPPLKDHITMHDLTRLLIETELAAGPGSSATVHIGHHGTGGTPTPYVLVYTSTDRSRRGRWGDPGIHVWLPFDGRGSGSAVALFTDDPHADPEDLLRTLIEFLHTTPIREEVVL